MGDYIGDYYGVMKGDTRSLDYGSNTPKSLTPNLSLRLRALV